MHTVNLWDEVEQVVVDFDTPATIVGLARNEPLGRGRASRDGFWYFCCNCFYIIANISTNTDYFICRPFFGASKSIEKWNYVNKLMKQIPMFLNVLYICVEGSKLKQELH